MSAHAASRKTILQSIYCIRRRRTALPLSEVTNLGLHRKDSNPKIKSASQTMGQPKSLIQGQKIIHRAPIAMGNAGVCSSKQMQTTVGRNMNNRSPNGALLRGIGIREHYAATAPTNSSPNLLHLGHDEYNHNNDVSSSGKATTSTEPPLVSEASSSSSSLEETTPKKSDLIVVLDLDECLVHSQFMNENEYRQHEERPQSQAFQNDTYEPSSLFASACESFRFALPDSGDLVHVNKRPNLDAFLQQVTQKYETHIFTAAMEVYASPLLDALDPDGTMFTKRYYRESCLYLPSHGVYVKDLSRVFLENYSSISKRIVLVDNNPMSFISNPKNGILVSNFYDDPKDDTLQAVLELLDELDGEEDVRPLLNNKFALKAALKEVMDVTNHQGKW